jgi:hypothetical protein
MDKIKDYLQNNRGKLDIYEPNTIRFDNIMLELRPYKKPPGIKRYLWIGIAASISMALIIFQMVYQNNPVDSISKKVIVNQNYAGTMRKESGRQLKKEQSAINAGTPIADKDVVKKDLPAKMDKVNNNTGMHHPNNTAIDSINLAYSKITNRYLTDINRALASNPVELREVNKQLQEMESDERNLYKLIGQFGPKANLIEALVRLNQQKIIYLQRIYRPIIKKESFM